MIKSFRHKGLEKFYRTGRTAGIQPAHANKLQLLLTALSVAENPQQMNTPGWNLHSLSGQLQGHYSVKVNGNWRLTFCFHGKDAEIVDYQDYH